MKIDRDISDASMELYRMRDMGGTFSLQLASTLQRVRNDERKAERDRNAKVLEEAVYSAELVDLSARPQWTTGRVQNLLLDLAKRIRKGKRVQPAASDRAFANAVAADEASRDAHFENISAISKGIRSGETP